MDDVPATISRILLTDILREELGYDGVVVTDALEMYGIADVAPLPEAAVRAIEAGADALCLGLWAFLDDVDVAAAALAEQVAVTHGDPVLRSDAVLIIRLEPTHSPAAGSAGWGVEKMLRAAGKVVESIGLSGLTYNGPGMARAGVGEFRSEYGADSQVVLLVRGAHRFDWQEKLIGELQSQHPDMIVVDMGVPGTDYSGFAGWIQTFGSARVCAEAATRRLLGSRARSVHRTTDVPRGRRHRIRHLPRCHAVSSAIGGTIGGIGVAAIGLPHVFFVPALLTTLAMAAFVIVIAKLGDP